MAINRDKVYDGAMKLLAAGKFDKGIAELQKLIVDDPKDVRTLLKIAETLHVKMGKRKEALESYDRAATLYTEQGFFLKAVAVFKQMLSVDATSPELHLRLAELYQQMGYSSQCLLHYQQVVVLYEQQGRSKDTLSILKRMVDLDPENLQSRVKVAELFHQQGMVAEAIAEMRQAFSFLRTQQRFDDALRVGEKVAAWDPNAVDIAKDLGTIYMQRGDAKNALAKLQLCFRLAPRDLEILGLIANAFLALDQTPKTISVYKEMARIYEGNDDVGQARSHWERVLELAPGDEDAETALGRRKAAPVAAAPAAPAAPRMSPEDDQLSRLMTETDVYVKYGLRDKAIEHLDKIFALRPEHLPALEKLRQLQNQTQQKAAAIDTLRLMVKKAEESGHARLAEWQGELAKLAPSKPAQPAQPAQPSQPPAAAPPAPVRKPTRDASMEGDLILVDDAPARPATPAPAPKPPPPVIRGGRPPVGIVSLEDEPLDPLPPVAVPKPTALPKRPTMTLLPPDESFEDIGAEVRGAPRRALPDDDEFDAPTVMATGLGSAVPRLPSFGDGQMMGVGMPAPRPTPAPPEVVLDEPADAFEADADQLVREALGMPPPPSTGSFPGVRDVPADPWGASNVKMPGLAPPLGSEEGMAADELVLEEEATSRGDDDDDDASMLDALAAQAVSEAAKNDAANGDFFSADEMRTLAAFASAVPDAAPLPAGSTFGEENHTVVYPGPTWGAKGLPGLDDSLNVTGVRRAAAAVTMPGMPVVSATAPLPSVAPKAPEPKPAPVAAAPVVNEFEDFDLPDDVKALLGRDESGAASSFPPAEPDGFDALDPLATAAFHRDGASSINDELNDSFGQSFGDVPSLASMDADAVVEVPAGPPPMGSVPNSAPVSAEFGADDEHGQMSAARELFAPTRGFEDDPANTFFPDELAEAEFFIQQDLLDEAREILEPILEEIDDSERVKHMLARVAAKEAGEPEPPAPWEQRLIDDVAAELDNMSLPPAPAMAPGQISVEEVLSQFKRGIAETVPEDDAATHYDLGIAYREMGLLEDAVGEFKVAARAASKAPDALFLVGLVRLEQGRTKEALDALDAAVEAPAATKAQRAAAEYQRGVIFADVEGDGAAGLLAFKRSKSLGGSAPDLDRRIAQLITVHGDLEAATSTRPNSDGRQKNIDYV